MKSSPLPRLGAVLLAFFGFLLSGCASLLGLRPGLPDRNREPSEILATYVEKRGLPAAALLVLGPEGTLVSEVAGVRKASSGVAVLPTDAFHIGSDTKAMTALLCAMAVDEGLLSWTSGVASVLGAEVGGAFGSVTLEELLSHSSGLPPSPPASAWKAAFERWQEPVLAERDLLARAALAMKPVSKPATAFLYSNFNYLVAGRMLETVYGCGWEELMRGRIFEPLGMEGAGFGPPETGPGVDAPWGHNPKPVPFGPMADNPPALGPAGTVHLSLADLEAWLNFVLAKGIAPDGRRLVSEEGFGELFKPRPGSGIYALGWGVVKGPKGETLYAHDGSNTMFYCSILVLPDSGHAIAVLANRGDGAAARRVAELREYLRLRYAAKAAAAGGS